MHVPSQFHPRDEASAWRVMDAYPWATVVTVDVTGAPRAAPLPVLARPERGELVSHLARANPMAGDLAREETRVLVVFQGPAGYVTPRWYGRPEPAVPTFDHVSVHVRGRPHPTEDPAAVLDVLRATVERFERDAPEPWRLDTQTEFVRGLARGVVAFTVAVEEVQAEFKLSQNMPADEQRRMVAGFEATGQGELAAAMRDELQLR